MSKNSTTQNEKVLPGFIEDNHKYDGKSTFCNIDAFSKQACQSFPDIGGKVRFTPTKGED